jgi:hypothetical protein
MNRKEIFAALQKMRVEASKPPKLQRKTPTITGPFKYYGRKRKDKTQ